MTAKGKINASRVQAGDRIIVKIHRNESGIMRYLAPSQTKTGEDVTVVRVTGKSYRQAGIMEGRGWYVIETTAGSFEARPIQTMILAPEDNAGIKRAHVEALAENAHRDHDAEWLNAGRDQDTVELAEDYDREIGSVMTEDIERADESRWSLGSIEDVHAEALREEEDRQIDGRSIIPGTEGDDAPAQDHTGSTVVHTLEKVWARIREDHPELPEVVIVTGSGLIGASKWGHFRADGWKLREEGSALHKHELFLAGEALAKGAAQVLQTMLHEGAHTLARVRSIQDTSRQGRWHNAHFLTLAGEMGLEHKSDRADKGVGWSLVTLTEATRDRYADLLVDLDADIRLTCHLPSWLGGGSDEDEQGGEKITGRPQGEAKTQSGTTRATCNCDEPNIIRLSRKVLDKRVVQCDDCDSLFTAA